MKNSTIITCLLIALYSFSSCNKKYDEPQFVPSEPEYVIDTSTPHGKKIQEFYNRTNSYILYENLNYRDFGWDFNLIQIIDPEITELMKEEIMPVLAFLDANLFGYYSDDYMAELFPYRISLAKKVLAFGNPRNFIETSMGMLISDIDKEFTELTPSAQTVYIRNMNTAFLTFAAKKIEARLPAEFFEISDYNFSMPNSATNKPTPKELGFWATRVSSGNMLPPTSVNDVIEWVKTIAKYTPAEIQEQFYYTVTTPSGSVKIKSQKMVEKYNIIQDLLINTYKTDLHKLEHIF